MSTHPEARGVSLLPSRHLPAAGGGDTHSPGRMKDKALVGHGSEPHRKTDGVCVTMEDLAQEAAHTQPAPVSANFRAACPQTAFCLNASFSLMAPLVPLSSILGPPPVLGPHCPRLASSPSRHTTFPTSGTPRCPDHTPTHCRPRRSLSLSFSGPPSLFLPGHSSGPLQASRETLAGRPPQASLPSGGWGESVRGLAAPAGYF